MEDMSEARHYPATARDWWQAARPHTWANAFSPVIAGTGAAAFSGGHHWGLSLIHI